MSTANFDIRTTIEQARTGDTGAFAQIVRQYQSLVSGVLFSATGDFHKSEDFTQETFLIAWQKLGELRETDHLAAWLCTIARNLVHRSHRKPTIATEPLIDETGGRMPPALASAALAPDAELLRQEQSDFVWSAIGNIEEKHRETLVLYYRGGQSVRDIASATESTEEAVRQRLVRARKSLKAKLEEMVGTILTDTAPGEAFTVGVLAAIPILATGNQVLAASSAGAAAAQSASSGGAGHSFLAGMTTFFWTFFVNSVLPTIVVGLGIALGIWSGIRNAPTLRARQWMIKVALGYFIFAGVVLLLVRLCNASYDPALYRQRSTLEWVLENIYLVHVDRMFLYNVCLKVSNSLAWTIPILVLVSSYFINHQWRKIVEEDMAKQDVQNQTVSPKGFFHSMYVFGSIALFTFISYLSVIILAVPQFQRNPWDVMSVVSITVLILGILLCCYAIRISKDQKCFEKSPPRLPNLLAILTGEEKVPRGFRNRINFWGDLTAIGFGLFCFHYVWCTLLHEAIANAFSSGNGQSLAIFIPAITVVPVIIAYMLFALFFAGIPRRRYWGMIFFGLSVLVSDVIIFGLIFLSMPFQVNYLFRENIWGLGLVAWYLLCFLFLGVAGLRVFRKKTSL